MHKLTIGKHPTQRPHPWKPVEVTCLTALVGVLAYTASNPLVVGDIAAHVLATQAIFSGWRMLNILMVLFVTFWVRRIPGWQKVGVVLIALGLDGNLARNVLSGSGLTVSFALGNAGLSVLLVYLAIRPTMYERMDMLKEEVAQLKARLGEE